MAKQPAAAQVLPFRRTAAPPPVPDIQVARRSIEAGPALDDRPALDLSDRAKVLFLIGAGHSGKTSIARFCAERASAVDRALYLIAMDPVNRTLASYAPPGAVHQPETSEPSRCVHWFGDALDIVQEQKKASAIFDFGGGNTVLAAKLDQMPDLADSIEASGMAPVAFYTLSPRVDDLADFLSLGFQPAATAFICNLGRTDPSMDRAAQFATTLSHPAVRGAIEKGARVIWMPALDAALFKHIEDRRASFGAASRGETGLTPTPAWQVRAWLKRMDEAFAPVASWLP